MERFSGDLPAFVARGEPFQMHAIVCLASHTFSLSADALSVKQERN